MKKMNLLQSRIGIPILRWNWFVVFCAFCVGNGAWSYATSGRTTANFLKVDVGGKATALAGNQFGAENDSFAQFVNPALLSGVSRKQIGFMHNEFFEDIRQQIFTFAMPTVNRGNFAVGINYFTYGDIEGFSADGAPTGNVSASDILLNASWAKKLNIPIRGSTLEGFSVGTSIKILSKKLHNDSALGFAFDLGLAYPVKWRALHGLKFAGALTNFGTGLKFKNESSPLPTTARFGFSYSFWGEALTTSFDEVIPLQSDPFPALGIQYKLMKMFFVRVGYKGNKDLDQKLTYGVGFENPLLRLDYAFVPFEDLGSSHRVSVIYRFGKTTGRPAADMQLHDKVKDAKTLYAQGLLVDAYLICIQIQRVAPWMNSNNKLLEKIQRDFRKLEEGDRREKLRAQVTALFTRAEKFFEEGNLINARLEFQAVLGLQPGHKAAQGYIRQIEGQFRSFVQSFYRQGMILFAKGDYIRAREEFEKVIAIQPDYKEAKDQLKRCEDILNKKKTAAAKAVRLDRAEKMYRDGLSAFGKRNYEKAVFNFKQVLKIDRSHLEAKRYLALSNDTLYKQYYKKGQESADRREWESAIENLKKAVDIKPNSREAMNLLVDSQRRWELQKKVLSQNLYKKGLESFLTGDKKNAEQIWKKALELDSGNEEAKRGLSRIRQ